MAWDLYYGNQINCHKVHVKHEPLPLPHMLSALQVKATPTFFLYRDGAIVDTVSGTGTGKLLRALLGQLREGERGKDWDEPATHSTFATDSSDENE